MGKEETVKLEVGKYYATREARLAHVEGLTGHDSYPFLGKIMNSDGSWDRGFIWTLSGRYLNETEDAEYDLLKKVIYEQPT
jgi:hypothetical protein